MTNIENSEAWYEERIAFLSGFMTDERFAVLGKAVQMRTRYMTILTENTFHPQNASALVRHCEAFGLQDIHTVETLCKFNPNLRVVRGTDKWIDFRRHKSTTEAVAALREAGYRIVATTPHKQDTTPDTFDVTRGKFALVFGTELAGISEEIVASADEFLRIPMCGMVESLNVSASAAILIQRLSARMRQQTQNWPLQHAEQLEVLFRWARESVQDADKILARQQELFTIRS
ncbi:MAG: RNA methyltransferase [Alistipes sp.]